MSSKLMSILNETWYPVVLPVSKKKLEVKPPNMKSNHALAELYQESINKKDMSILINAQINRAELCIRPDQNGKILNVRKLHIADFIFLSKKLQSISSGSDKYNAICQKEGCDEKENIVKIDIEDHEIINLDSSLEVIMDEGFSKKIILQMKELTVETVYENPEIIKQAKNIESIMKMLSFFIDSIVIEEQIFESTQDEKLEFLLNLTEKQLKPLASWFENLTRLIIKKEFICKKCKEKQELVIDNMMQLLN